MDLEFSNFIDMKLAIFLCMIGLGLKHLEWKPIKQLSNKLIPALLIILGIGLECIFQGDVTFDGILNGIITAVFSVGMHSSGKNVLKSIMGMTESNTVFVDDLSGSSNAMEHYDECVQDDVKEEGQSVG